VRRIRTCPPGKARSNNLLSGGDRIWPRGCILRRRSAASSLRWEVSVGTGLEGAVDDAAEIGISQAPFRQADLIRRVLRRRGFAVLPVPVVNVTTVEYAEPNPNEWGHVRAPGLDDFDRYERHFRRVRRYVSAEFDARFQPFLYEDRTLWPTPRYPLRQRSVGTRHNEVVPVAYVS